MFSNYFFKAAICILIFVVQEIFCDDEGECILYKPDGNIATETDWLFGITLPRISDESLPGLISSLKTENIIGIEKIESNTISVKPYVNITLNEEKSLLLIELLEEFKHYEENEVEETLDFMLTFQCKKKRDTITIHQGIIDTNNHSPEFLGAPYNYILPMPIPKHFRVDSDQMKIIARDIDISNRNITFSLDSTDDKTRGFSIIWSAQDAEDGKKHHAHLLTTDLIDLNDDVSFDLLAKDTGQPSRSTKTTVTIKVDKSNSAIKFSQPLYAADCRKVKINETIPIQFDNEVSVTRGFEQSMKIDVESNPKGYENFFAYETTTDGSKITFKLVQPSEKLLREKFVFLTLKIIKVSSSASAILHIQLPGMNAENPAPKLSFQKNIYRFQKDVTFIGTLMKETASLENGEGTILYSGIFQDEDLKNKISIDPSSAEVNVKEIILPGIYTFEIVAEEKNFNVSTRSNVLLIITSSKIGEIEYALRIVEVEEEKDHEKIISLGNEDCTYVIQSQTPSQDWFYVNGNSLNTKKIDRELSVFSNMSVAQVRLVIETVCPAESSPNERRIKRDTEYDVILGNIPFTRTKMRIIAIINDINDNAPIWDKEIPKVIGYPSNQLSKFILAPSLHNLSATDADVGENAVITYSLKESTTFYIHPKTGTLYMQEKKEIENSVTAVASDGVHDTPLDLSIQLLDVRNVVALYVKDAVTEDVQKILSKIQSNLTNYLIGSLGAAVIKDSGEIPNSDNIIRSSDSTNTLLRIYVHGFNETSKLPIDENILKSVLQTSGVPSEVTSLDEIIISPPSQPSESGSDLFFVTTIILGLILGTVFIGLVVFYARRKRTSAYV